MKNKSILSIILFLVGCNTPQDIENHELDDFNNKVTTVNKILVLGETTKQQIIKIMGEPESTQVREINGVEDISIVYSLYVPLGDVEIPGSMAQKIMLFGFTQNTLYSHLYTSTFLKDSTRFDLNKARSIKKNQSKNDVLSIMGPPSGKSLFLSINGEQSEKVYSYSYAYFVTKSVKQQERGTLRVDFNENDIVCDVVLITE